MTRMEKQCENIYQSVSVDVCVSNEIENFCL